MSEKDQKVHSLEEVRRKRSESAPKPPLEDQDSIPYHPFEMDEETVSVDENGVYALLSEDIGGVYMDPETAISLGVALIQAAQEKKLLDLGQLLPPGNPEAG